MIGECETRGGGNIARVLRETARKKKRVGQSQKSQKRKIAQGKNTTITAVTAQKKKGVQIKKNG